jgi:hypothetical protein
VGGAPVGFRWGRSGRRSRLAELGEPRPRPLVAWAVVLPPTTDPRIFFQIAAALVPALVFGGLVSDRFKPPRHWSSRSSRWWVASMAVLLCGLSVFYGEVIAIEVGLTGSPDRFETSVVAGVVVGLTALTVGSVVWPWVTPMFTMPRSRRAKRVVIGVLIAPWSSQSDTPRKH